MKRADDEKRNEAFRLSRITSPTSKQASKQQCLYLLVGKAKQRIHIHPISTYYVATSVYSTHHTLPSWTVEEATQTYSSIVYR